MDDFSVQIRGLADTQRTLYKFSAQLGDRVTLMALRSGANYMLKKTRAAAPKKTGRLRRAITVKKSKIYRRRRNGQVGVYISIKKGRKRNDPKGAYYGRFVEGGHKKASGGRVKGRFFIRNTYNSTKNQAAQLIIRNMQSAGQALANKLR